MRGERPCEPRACCDTQPRRAVGVERDLIRAAEAFRKGCAKELAEACWNLAHLLKTEPSLAVVGSDASPADLLTKACDLGMPKGCDQLGIFYYSGDGVTKDEARAASLFERSCTGGEAAGCHHLGVAMFLGQGVAKDDAAAMRLFRRACDGDQGQACYNLGVGLQRIQSAP